MNLAYLASCFFSTTEKIWMLRDSAMRFGIDLQLYGLNRPHLGFIDCKVTQLLPELEALLRKGYTHVLYTDGPDTFFVRGHEAIMEEYLALGSPAWLMSAERNCYPHTDLSLSIPEESRYPCTGQYMGEIETIREGWSAMRDLYGPGDNEQGWALRALSEGKTGMMVLDRQSRVFRSEADDWIPSYSACVLHFNGGYYDPHEGREPRMRPIWNKLYDVR